MIEMNGRLCFLGVFFFVKWLKFSDNVKVGELKSVISDRKKSEWISGSNATGNKIQQSFFDTVRICCVAIYVFVK